MRQSVALIFLVFIGLWEAPAAKGQTIARSGIRLSRISYLTSNIDSLTRAFIKRGYHIKPGKREPGGIFSNSIIFPNGCEIVLETMNSSSSDDWRLQALRKYGEHISGIGFETRDIDSLYGLMSMAHLPLSVMDSIRMLRSDSSSHLEKIFALGGCAPLDVVFYSADTASRILPKPDSLSHHRNGVFRFDWVLLSAAPEVEARIRTVFDLINGWKQHEGCCDFWRVGPSNDFCFFRFDPPPKKAKASSDWLSIEPDAIYFAY